jgi:7,8-dihydropterin-6-yl-methyl-4-(beta-D-ribofuranosyl)aminobenzene 5'-phosphate synthase
MTSLTEVDSLEILVVIDNELDPISTYQIPGLTAEGNMMHIAFANPEPAVGRGPSTKELKMDNICYSAHGLSLIITARKGDVSHTLMFDTGPEEGAWERNVMRLRPDLSKIELIQLSHWHRDHSGGMLRAISMINEARGRDEAPVKVDLHPSRPDFRGFTTPNGPISMEADPTFDEIMLAGGEVIKKDKAHTVLDGMFMVSGEIPR